MTAATSTARETQSSAGPSRPLRFPRRLQAGFWLCIAIGIAVALRRAFILQRPIATNGPPELMRLDAYFQSHDVLTYVHILAALLFVCVLPFVFWTRSRCSTFVRNLFYALGATVGLSAFGMSMHPVGGVIEGSAVVVYNSLFLAALLASYRASRAGQEYISMRWTLRATAISLGIATTRPVMGIFFATDRLTHLAPAQFFGLAFWIGFTTNTLVLELWLRKHTIALSRSFQ